MVDRAPVGLTVHDCPAHRLGAILVVVEEFRLATGLERFEVFWRQRTGQGWIPLDEPGPIITFTGPPGPAEHDPPFDQLDPALLQAGWAVLGPWTRYSAGGVWSTQACQVDEQRATPPAVAAPVVALAW